MIFFNLLYVPYKHATLYSYFLFLSLAKDKKKSNQTWFYFEKKIHICIFTQKEVKSIMNFTIECML